MYKTLTRYTLLWSFILGALIGVLVYRDKSVKIPKNYYPPDNYDKWFNNLHLKRTPLSIDYIRYGNSKDTYLESQFLYDRIKIMCVILVRKHKNAVAANETWAQKCNDKTFVYLQSKTEHKVKLPIRQTKLKSSWYLLCNAIRSMNSNFHWVVFVYDDTFVIPENVRRLVADLDYNKGYYLGHAIQFWGIEYNKAMAGYVLSKGSITKLRKKFDTSKKCADGGRFWKQEDYYLGKHLAELGVFPSDTRDNHGLTTFHGYNLPQLVTPGYIQALSLTNYYSRSVYPATNCCSPYTVTFQTIEYDNMHFNYYLLYQLQIFNTAGQYGNVRSNQEHDEVIWRSFVSEQRGESQLFEGEMSPQEFFELWKNVVNDPINFNRNIRKWSAQNTSTSDSLLHSD